ncbi:MAG: hypothetical protein P4L51_12040 [Puia sp.]|nr:hypothetical protein [Puia sp.]
MNFSQRIGLKPSMKTLQIGSIDDDLRIGLWNVYASDLIQKISRYRDPVKSALDRYFEYLWKEYYKFPVDTRSGDHVEDFGIVRKKYFEYEWSEVYDFIEFNSQWEIARLTNIDIFFIREEFNKVMEREFAGYRFIDDKITAISNQVEMDSVKEALRTGKGLFQSKHAGVN